MKFSELDKRKKYKDDDGTPWEFMNDGWHFLSAISGVWVNGLSPAGDECDFTEKTLDKESKATSTQVDGAHYKEYAIQPYEFFHKNKVPHGEACVIKYVLRHRSKNGLKDLEKAKHYIDLIIEMEYGE